MNYKMKIGLLLLVTVAMVLVPGASALPAYATSTGASCGTCHVNPLGGGTLTAVGETYKQTGSLQAPTPAPTTAPAPTPAPTTPTPTTPSTVTPDVQPQVTVPSVTQVDDCNKENKEHKKDKHKEHKKNKHKENKEDKPELEEELDED